MTGLGYTIAAYVAGLGLLAGYALSLWAGHRELARQMARRGSGFGNRQSGIGDRVSQIRS